MKQELEKIKFKLSREYVHGDNEEFITQSFRKGNLLIDLDYDKESGKLIHHDLTIEEVVITPTFQEIIFLDKIINQ